MHGQSDVAEVVRIEALNRSAPSNPDRIVPAKPFVLLSPAAGANTLSAADCLTAAVYYEAGNEPLEGQRAVAQVVLNRVRHPAFPASVCAVVFEGAARTTGCQFTFTCDGSLRRTPTVQGWRRAQGVAIAALSGYVEPSVGHATHYHADYVRPDWAGRLIKLRAIASHIFYLWPGSAGTPQAFAQKYAGQEDMPASAAASLSLNLLSSPAGSAYRDMFPDPRADGASSVESPRAIASTPIPPAGGAIAAPDGGGSAMVESKGQLRITQGRLRDDLAAPRPIGAAPDQQTSPR
jgi:hypothetical protein